LPLCRAQNQALAAFKDKLREILNFKASDDWFEIGKIGFLKVLVFVYFKEAGGVNIKEPLIQIQLLLFVVYLFAHS
jgi:hypothetical protein